MAGLRPLHVGLDALDLAPGRAGGIETYFRSLASALLARPPEGVRFTVFGLAPALATLPAGRDGFRLRAFECSRPSPCWLVRGLARRLAGLDPLAPAVRRLGLDVVHHPFTTINTPGLRGAPVLTVHDLQHEYFPGNFGRAELARRRRAYPASARAAARIIAISAHVKGTLVERYGIDPARIAVVHHAAGPEFRPAHAPAAVEALRRRHGLLRPYLYYPAASWPHKNHGVLLRAMRLLADRGRFDGDLVLTGLPREGHGHVNDAIRRLDLADRVRILGHLPAAELPLLYAAATLLVFPSRFEGFGLPVLEAMASGCPVVCADATSLPEVAGGAALLFDPDSPEALADRVAEVLESSAVRRRLVEAGLGRAAGFSWERAARETVEVYRGVG